MKNNLELRNAILDLLPQANNGPAFTKIVARLNMHHDSRRVDRALQALRRAGAITYNRKCGWRLV